MGDFNLPDIDWHLMKSRSTNGFSTNFVDVVQDNYLIQMVAEPTRARNGQAANLLDLLLVTDERLIDNVKYCSPLGSSDHIVLRFHIKVEAKVEKTTVKKLLYDRGNYDQMRLELRSRNWQAELNQLQGGVQECWSHFLNIYVVV